MIPDDSPALRHKAPEYPYNGTPLKVRIVKAIFNDPNPDAILAAEGDEYECYVEADGELAAIVEGELVWLREGEFEVIGWHGKVEEKP